MIEGVNVTIGGNEVKVLDTDQKEELRLKMSEDDVG